MSAALQRLAYTLFSPFYDLVIEAATRRARAESLSRLDPVRDVDLLLCGAGSGLDLPHLPPASAVTALDLTPAMIRRASRRADRSNRKAFFVVGDATALPFAEGTFDAVILHLILAVVPRPDLALASAARVLRPGGRLLIFDKFLKPGERAPVRKLANLVLAPLLTRTDLVFEDLLPAVPIVRVTDDRPALLGGWFRFITLERGDSPPGEPGGPAAGTFGAGRHL